MSDFMVPEISHERWALVEEMGETRWIPAEYVDADMVVTEKRMGWGAHFTAPGYLDQTEWQVFDSEREAVSFLVDEMLEVADLDDEEAQEAAANFAREAGYPEIAERIESGEPDPEWLAAWQHMRENARMTESDRHDFVGFLRQATDRQLFGILEKEQAAGRRGYVRLVEAEIERRGLARPNADYRAGVPHREWEREFERIVSEATEEAHQLMMRQPWEAVYLYYVASDLEHGGSLIPVPQGRQPPPRAELAFAERLPANTDWTGLRAFIRERVGRLPILGTAFGRYGERSKKPRRLVSNRKWSTKYQNDLPDSAFLYVAPGGRKDSEGKTVPRSLRHLPYKNMQGNVDCSHLRNALARMNQVEGLSKSKEQELRKKAERLYERHCGYEKNPAHYQSATFRGHDPHDPTVFFARTRGTGRSLEVRTMPTGGPSLYEVIERGPRARRVTLETRLTKSAAADIVEAKLAQQSDLEVTRDDLGLRPAGAFLVETGR